MIQIDKTEVNKEEIYSFTLPNFEEYQNKIKQIVLVESNSNINTTPKQECNVKAGRTAWNSHRKYPIINDINNDLNDILIQLIKNENFDVPNIKVGESWINWYGKNQFAVPHHHKDCLAAVLFVDVESSDASFLVHKTSHYMLQKKNESTTYSNIIQKINVKNGHVILFDGSLVHSVSPNLTDNTRITLATNFYFTYDKDRSEY